MSACALVAGHAGAVLLGEDGELRALSPDAARDALRSMPPPLVVHLPATARRIGLAGFPALDLLELFAFAHPARPATPTPLGLAIALGIAVSGSHADPAHRLEAEASLLPDLADAMLAYCASIADTPRGREARGLATALAEAGWPWARSVLARMGPTRPGGTPMPPADALAIWRRLPAWEEASPRPPPASHPIPPQDSRTRLAALLGAGAAYRSGQADYAHAAALAFAPRERRGDPILMLAEAGTGTGKTLGYVAPASLWAERNGGTVWISTYTRHLQRQIERELARLEPDPARRRRRIVVRKGRENYLCLLNLEEEIRLARSNHPARATLVPLALLVRWASHSSDGDCLGGDLPGWFRELFGAPILGAVADRRGECIHGACPHYATCFVEHSIRRARDADLVIANHALVMAQAAYAGTAGGVDGKPAERVPTRYVFDEGHHLAEAADAAFAVALSGAEAAELRRWLLGAEGARTRARGLRRRLGDLIEGDPELETPLEAALLAAAQALVAPGWAMRLGQAALPRRAATADGPGAADGPDAAEASGAVGASGATAGLGLPHPMENVLAILAQQALAREAGAQEAGAQKAGAREGTPRGGSSIAWTATGAAAQGAGPSGSAECDLHPLAPGLAEAASRLARALARIVEPLATLVARLEALLDTEAETLDAARRGRIEAMAGVIRRRALDRIGAWISMLDAASGPPPAPGTRPDHVSFIRLDYVASRGGAGAGSAPGGSDPGAGEGGSRPVRDVALCRHWLDPTLPFILSLAPVAHGMLVTSATLRDESAAADGSLTADGSDDMAAERAWEAAEARAGALHLPSPALRAGLPSPFDYARQSRCFVVTDIPPADLDALAAAFRTLFLASAGGGLGLFTAISRLRAVHARIARPLEAAGLPLLAQHVDAMDNATLVDIFRTEAASCLLGTDAMRDGVDVPGAALRLVVFERVPWMRPDILHRERRLHLSAGNDAAYDDRIVRLRLRQAFGRLIRTETDRGAFVLLDRRMPSRLANAFPRGVAVERLGLAETVARVRDFLG